jgi:dGTPase
MDGHAADLAFQPAADAVAADFERRIRELESEQLSPLATPSYPATRERDEQDCRLRTPFQRDRDRIVHSKAFRRLKHKTQVFIAPEGDHYRTRLTHTIETCGISRTVARALRLNEDLTEAVGLGHDLGHPPFGHTGEEALDAVLHERIGRRFRHNEHSLRVVEVLERDGAGLNLTEPVRDGILRHTGPELPSTLEARIVRLVDRIAYINHDIDDALRAGVLDEGDLPADEIALLGDTGSARIDALVHDLVEHSERAGDIVQGEEVGAAMAQLRKFMFERVYLGAGTRGEQDRARHVVRTLFEHYMEQPEFLPGGGGDGDQVTRVTDYIAGMTDRFCIATYKEIALPRV